uniref:Uncharacterized protein n=1 Tax=mine drainage metagenome TaxID=410659 RepID=E6PXU9_9ZZZZ
MTPIKMKPRTSECRRPTRRRSFISGAGGCSDDCGRPVRGLGLLTWTIIIAFIAGFAHQPALHDITRPEWRRLVVDAFAFILLAFIVLPVPGAQGHGMLNCLYMGGR